MPKCFTLDIVIKVSHILLITFILNDTCYLAYVLKKCYQNKSEKNDLLRKRKHIIFLQKLSESFQVTIVFLVDESLAFWEIGTF